MGVPKVYMLSRRLWLEAPVQVSDGAGGMTVTWAPLGALWAEIKAGAGSEETIDGLTVSTVSYKITVRGAPIGALSRPKAEQRFRDGTRVFSILSVAETDPNARYLTCTCREEGVSV